MDQLGGPPDDELPEGAVVWPLGTHLSTTFGPLALASKGAPVLLIEAHGFARRRPYHVQKLTLVFAAMRAFRDRLRAEGYDVSYVQAETFAEGLRSFLAERPGATLVSMGSPSHGGRQGLVELVADVGGVLRLVPDQRFLCPPAAFDDWAGPTDGDPLRQETFYRWMRRETGVLMTDDGPVGGDWNYDEENRAVPPADWSAPAPFRAPADAATREVVEWVTETFDTWGTADGFGWPIDPEAAAAALEHFVAEALPAFGPYQDAMRAEDWAMAHSLLASSINLGLLHPGTVIERVERAYHEDDAVPLNSAEGCIRQLLGWREFVRHVYRREMPGLATANRLDATASLPPAYWSGETQMACLGAAVESVRRHGYAHHIQRLMVLANLATLLGVDPAALNDWFHATFVDAYHWVTTPNVVEMGAYAHGAFATKPYVSSANYVDRQSDHCEECAYDPDERLGPSGCPFNALYWDFLATHEGRLRSNPRVAAVYGHVDRLREEGDLEAIRKRGAELRRAAADGTL